MNEVKQDAAVRQQESAGTTSTSSALASLRRIRIDEALARFGGDQERYIHWLIEFTEHGPNAAAQIRQAITNGTIDAATKLAHALKGRTGMLGMGELHAICQTLELALRSGDPPLMWLEELETAVDEMRAQITTALGPGR
ncbi:Hpt domain-containing protein [Propionivibrio dicarboxylicus]|uniref:HPt (Histidine-containing phosphotransfer) domain-containing protein n=1 Tax=Propionivibrio dicarboxylicus TaxID=83767 RepID=A0A1G8KPB5_9RHOO|nr:Hpt domain-containing protein [Propionivibrio dicarboxylicus]SDI45243.1 HPt (histidine-containing phosphotransfer) domain-containing protein [Propionivibrio dicarboxylicus]